MREQHWTESRDPEQMVRGLWTLVPTWITPRTLWSFIVGCYRLWWLTDDSLLYPRTSEFRQALVEALGELQRCGEIGWDADWDSATQTFRKLSVRLGSAQDLGTEVLGYQGLLPRHWFPIFRGVILQASRPGWSNSPEEVAGLLRCIFEMDIRSIRVDRKGFNEDVVRIAHRIYAENRFDEMPVLGDALEEAGCQNEDVLAHCRCRTQHARGCWVVDLILEKR